MFIHDDKMVEYQSDSLEDNLEYDFNTGIMGHCVKLQKSLIIADMKMSSFYNSLVDINSLMSVICLPIIRREIE